MASPNDNVSKKMENLGKTSNPPSAREKMSNTAKANQYDKGLEIQKKREAEIKAQHSASNYNNRLVKRAKLNNQPTQEAYTDIQQRHTEARKRALSAFNEASSQIIADDTTSLRPVDPPTIQPHDGRATASSSTSFILFDTSSTAFNRDVNTSTSDTPQNIPDASSVHFAEGRGYKENAVKRSKGLTLSIEELSRRYNVIESHKAKVPGEPTKVWGELTPEEQESFMRRCIYSEVLAGSVDKKERKNQLRRCKTLWDKMSEEEQTAAYNSLDPEKVRILEAESKQISKTNLSGTTIGFALKKGGS